MRKYILYIFILLGGTNFSWGQNLGYFSDLETNNAFLFTAQSAQLEQKQLTFISRKNIVQSSIINQHFFSFQMPFNKNKSGLNLNVYSNSKENEIYNLLKMGYAYKVNFYGAYLSLGASYLLQNASIKQLLIKDVNDEYAPNSGFSNWKSDFNLSVMYKSKNVQTAFGTDNIFRGKENIFYTSPYLNYYLSATYKIGISHKICIYPAVLGRFKRGKNNVHDFSAKFQLDKKISFGLGYRTNEMGFINCDFLLNSLNKKIPNTLVFHYTYDCSLNSSLNFTAHEVGLRYTFGNQFNIQKEKQAPAQYSPVFF